jgi:hypothetical protein
LQPKLLGDEDFVEGFLRRMAKSPTPPQLRDLGHIGSVSFTVINVDLIVGFHHFTLPG